MCVLMSSQGKWLKDLTSQLWEGADELRANSKLSAAQYSKPVLGLIFLKFADHRFQEAMVELKRKSNSGRRTIQESDYQALGVMYLPEGARWSDLIKLPEGENIGRAVNLAMSKIEERNDNLRGALPKVFNDLEKSTLIELIRLFDTIPMDSDGDTFGRIYEFFLAKFAKAEGQGGGEFYTPLSLVQLIVQIIAPFEGKLLDPACGSGGMFVQSAKFLKEHRKNPNSISVHGMEKTLETVNLSKINLAVHQLSGQVIQANSYYEDPFKMAESFDYVMANPPFNVDKIDKDRIKDDVKRYPLGMPNSDNGNYIWIQMFYGALNATGKAGFVMADSAGDSGHSEAKLRKKLIQTGSVDVIVSVGPKFFFTLPIACTLWFLDKGKSNNDTADSILFIDATDIFEVVDRAHHEFTPGQIEFISNIVRLYRGEEPEFHKFSEDEFRKLFPDMKYLDVKGLCKLANQKVVEDKNWSLNPGKYVGVPERVNKTTNEVKLELRELVNELGDLDQLGEELDVNISKMLQHILGD